MRKTLGLLLGLALLPAVPAGAQTASLVADLEPGPPDSSSSGASRFISLGNKVLFLAVAPGSGQEVWASDGTASGTEILADACPGDCSMQEGFLGTAAGLAFWQSPSSSDDLAPRQLWRSDGTPAGTFPLSFPELGLSVPDPEYETDWYALTGDRLYFAGCANYGGECHLWSSDGTAAGTRKVEAGGRDLDEPSRLEAVGRRVFFLAGRTDPQSELWVSDGTAAGTTLLRTFSLNALPTMLTAVGNRLFFVASEGGREDYELWGSDGTAAGTRALTSFAAASPFYGWIKDIGGKAYFVADDVLHGVEIWRSDGTPAGTVRVTDFGYYRALGNLAPTEIEEVGGRLVFKATDGLHEPGLWVAAGAPGTPATPLADWASPLLKVGGRLVFLRSDTAHGVEVWSTDGRTAGTQLVKDICPGSCTGAVSELRPMLGAAFFLGRDAGGAQELWRTDGTAAGTRRFSDLGARARIAESWDGAATADGRVFFAAATDLYGVEPWVSDGRPGGTRMVTDIARTGKGPGVYSLASLGSRVLFNACSAGEIEIWGSAGAAESTSALTSFHGRCRIDYPTRLLDTAGPYFFFIRLESSDRGQLWRTDGTAQGTLQLTSFDLGRQYPYLHAVAGGRFFFSVPNDGRQEVWTSDGTPAGTRKAFDLHDPEAFIYWMMTDGSELFLVTYSRSTGQELVRSDGTQAGTQVLSAGILDFSRQLPQLARVGSRVFFTAQDFDRMHELWVTDGTAAGTRQVVDLGAGGQPSDLVAFQGALYFFADTTGYSRSRAFWRSDGTAAGTVQLQVEPQRQDTFPLSSELTLFNGALFFVASDEGQGRELWKSDGTAAGTAMLRDVHPGPTGSDPAGLTVAGGRLFFRAHDGTHGFELWQSDGTAAGTRLVHDIAPGPASSRPRELTETDAHLFFLADDGLTGEELWALPLAEPPGCRPSSTRLCLNGGRFQVEASWRDFQNRTGRGTAVPLTADTGTFWFFGPENVEVVLKVLDGQGVNGHHWVFYGALSDVEYTLTVTDTRTGATARYFNPSGQLASVGDVTGFGPLGAFGSKSVDRVSSPSAPARATTRFDPAAATGVCVPGPTRLCLNGGRFAVEAAWRAQGRTDAARAVPLTADTGYFWFFGADNVEVVLKVLDGRGYNGHFWVFYGALSDVEYTLTVTDTQTGQVKTYANPKGRFASVGDTAAF